MKVGARNRITATVTNITKGKVMCLVKVNAAEIVEINLEAS